MKDTQITVTVGADIFTVLINECKDDSPWLGGYGATMNGAPCELEAVNDALAVEHDLPEDVSWNFEHDDALEALWDSILVPALAALRSGICPKTCVSTSFSAGLIAAFSHPSPQGMRCSSCDGLR